MGLDDLVVRAKQVYDMGVRFAKWGVVFKIGDSCCPTLQAIRDNVWTVARFAAICQANGLVPMVSIEILSEGTHDVTTCMTITEKILAAVMKAMSDNNVFLEGVILMPSMVTPGVTSPTKATVSSKEIAEKTVTVLSRTVPPAVPGIMVSSGTLTEEEATSILSDMNKIPYIKVPWTISFSYGTALLQSSIKTWSGKNENVAKSQESFMTRVKANSEAQLGKLVK